MENKRRKKKLVSLEEASKIFGYSKDYISYLAKKKEIEIIKKNSSCFVDLESISEYRKNKDKRFKEEINRDWRKKKRAKNFIHDIIPPIQKDISSITENLSEKMKLVEKNVSIWTKTFYLFLKTLKYGSVTLVLGIVIFGGFFSWALSPRTETIEIYPTVFEGDWNNPQNALKRNLSEDSDLYSFKAENSASINISNFIIEEEFKISEDINNENQTEEIIAPKQEVEEVISQESSNDEEQLPEISFFKKTKNLFSVLVARAENQIDNIINQNEEEKEIAENNEIVTSSRILETPHNDSDIEEKVEVEEHAPPQPVNESKEEITLDENENIIEKNIIEKEIEKDTFENISGIILPDLEGNLPFETDIGLEKSINEEVYTVFTEQKSIVYSGFDFQNQQNEIKKIKLGLSFASFGELNSSDEILVEWSLDGEKWNNTFKFAQNQNHSNRDNGGYFYANIFDIKNNSDYQGFDSEKIKNLKIKFTAFGNDTNWNDSFIDALWIETEYENNNQEKKENDINEEKFEILSMEKDFKAEDNPEFHFKYKKKEKDIISSIWDSLTNANDEYWKNVNFSIEITNPKGEAKEIKAENFENKNISFILKNNGEITLQIEKEENFKPGLYKVVLKVEENGETQIIEYDFTWGVLAINVNKSIYLPSEEAYLQMGVLRNDGHTICDAFLELRIINQNSSIETIFSTENGMIEYSGKCSGDNVTDVPDYFAHYQVGEAGVYEITLTRLDQATGEKISEITDSFEVRESVPFEVERIGPTRIWPMAPYEIVIKIIANQDFEGEIIETVPEGFEISNISNNGVIASKSPADDERDNLIDGVTNSGLLRRYAPRNDKIITWQASLKVGNEMELRYTFDAPDISPYIYLLGPLKIGEFSAQGGPASSWQEVRKWQIASDAPTKWYFRNTTAAAGPSGELSSDTDSYLSSPTNKNTALDMTVAKGSSQTSAALNVSGDLGTMKAMMRMFVSPPLTSQTLTASDTITLGVGTQESSVQMNLYHRFFVYVWRNGSGNVKTILTPVTDPSEEGTSEKGCVHNYTGATGDFSIQANDRIVVEVWADWSPQKTSSYTGTLYWDGTTDVVDDTTTSDAASYISFLNNTITTFTPITFSGGCFTDASESTPCSDAGAEEIAVSVNGAAPTTVDTTVDGAWSGTINQPASGDILTFFINGEATESEEATTVVKYDGSGDVDFVKMYQSMLVIGTDTGSANSDQTITNSDLNPAGNGYDNTDDEDIIYSYNAGTSTLTTETLYIISGDTYRPDSAGGETLNTLNIYIEGTLISDNNSFNIAGNFTNTGTFSANTSTFTFNGSSAQTITSGGTSFNLVTFNNSSASDPNINYTGALSVGSNITLSNATRVAQTDNANFSVTGTINSNDATDRILTIASGTGDISISGAIGATNDLASLTITGNDITLANIGGGASGVTGATSITGDATGTIILTGTIYNTAGTQAFNAGGATRTVTLNEAATFTATNNTIAFTGLVDSQTTENNAITLNAGTAQVTFNNNIGATQSIGLLTKQGSGDLLFGSSTLTATGFTLSAGTVNNVGTDSGAWNVSGNVTISGGTFKSTTNTLTIGGNFTNNASFVHNSGTVTFNGTGTSQLTYSADTTFYQFSVLSASAGKNVKFDEAQTTIIDTNGDLTIQGSDCTDGRIFLDSYVNDDPWLIKLDTGATQNINYIDLEDADATGTVVTPVANNSTETGSNTAWTVNAGACSVGITVSGTVWTNEAKTTNIGINKTVHLFVNTTDKSTVETNESGQFSFSNISGVSTGDSVIVYLDNETENGSAVTLAIDGTTDITNFDIYIDHIRLEHRTAGPISNTNLDNIDAVDAENEDGITVSGGNAEFADGFELYIKGAYNYTPGGTVTVDGFEAETDTGNNPTFSPGVNSVIVSGSWEFSSTGTFTTLGTVTFDGTLAQTIITGGKTFSSLTINNTGTDGANDDVTISGALDINGVFSMTNGDLRLDTNNPDINIAGDVTIGSSAYITKGLGMWTFDGTEAKIYTDISSSGPQNIGVVSITKTNGTPSNNKITLASNMKVDIATISANNTLDLASSGYVLTLANTGATATVFTVSGTLAPGTNSTVKYAATNSGGNVNVTTTIYNSIEFAPDSAETYDMTGNLTGANAITGNITIGANATFNAGTGGVPVITASDTLPAKYSSDPYAETYATSYTKIKELTMTNDYTGSWRIKFDFAGDPYDDCSGECTGHARIYKNDVAYGIERSNNSVGFITYSEDFTGINISSGDLIQLYIYANPGFVNAAAQNFKIQFDETASGSSDIAVSGNWSNYGAFTADTSTVTFTATDANNTISDGGSPFYNIIFNGTGGDWLYANGSSTAPNQTTVQAGTPTYLNTKTGTVSVTGGTLNVDWYLGTHIVDAYNTVTDIDTADADITISENSGTPQSTVWRHNGTIWGAGATSQTTGTDASGKNPQPNTDGAIRIREYSMTASASCPGAGCTIYNYNLQVDWQAAYGQYDYYVDYGNEYLTSCLSNTSACDDDGATSDDTIGVLWYRSTASSMNGSKEYDGVNNPPTQGSWYVGMTAGLSFSIDSFSVNLGTIDPGAAPTDGTNTLTVTTSGTNGYVITAWTSAAMTCSDTGACGAETITDWTGTNGTPTSWTNGSSFFGYTTNDSTLNGGGADRFTNGGPKYAGFAHIGPGDPVADRTSSECPCSGQANTITYRIESSATQRPGPYSATVIYIATATY